MVDAVLLDWEGVLADTAVARSDAFQRALVEESVRVDALRADPALAGLVALRASRAFAEWLGKGFVLLPGAREFMEQVQLGARIAVVTSATRAETEFVLRLAGLDGAVSTIVSADDALDGPPAPAMVTRALEQLARVRALRRERVVCIASTSPVLRAARAAGVHTVAVNAPAHVAIDADGATEALRDVTLGDLARLGGITALERRS